VATWDSGGAATGVPVILRKIELYASRLIPNVTLLNRLLVAPDFYRRFGRLPRSPTSRGADYHDFLVERMTRNGWSELHLRCVDKEEAKAVAKSLAPGIQVPRTVAIIPTPRSITFEQFQSSVAPFIGQRLVAKPTHGTGHVVFLDHARERDLFKLYRACRYNYFYIRRETQYLKLAPKLIMEENISDDHGAVPDFKFFCANGRILFAQIDTDRFVEHKRVITMPPDFDRVSDVRLGGYECPDVWRPPENIQALASTALRLAAPFDFVRIDLYNKSSGIFFGEFTFTPAAGMEPFADSSFSKTLLRQIMGDSP